MSKLQTLAQFWQTFNLSNVQADLDEVATGITARQDESETSRKLLIELIRDFKKDNSEEVRSAVGPLVKAFQNEVDALSRRSKSSEKAFFDIYKQLVDVADPTPILEQVPMQGYFVAKLLNTMPVEL
jgi:homeobox protein cut-like